MIIKELNIKHFGKLHDRRITLSEGINVLYGPNESGKTTLHTFLKSMFFGLTRQRGRASKNDTYSRYEPWDGAGIYGGILWFQCEGRSFRLSRNFRKGNVTAELVCQDDGEILSVEDGDLEALLGNISEAVYENTVSIAQLKSATDQGLVRELQNYMASYQGSGDAAIDLNRTMQALKMWRKGYQDQLEKHREDVRREQEKMSDRMEYLERELSGLKLQEAKVRAEQEGFGDSNASAGGGNEAVGVYDRKLQQLSARKMWALCLSLLLLAAGIGGLFLLSAILWKVVAGAVCAAAEFLLALYVTSLGREQNKVHRMKAKKLKKQEKLQWSLEKLQEEIQEKETALENLRTDYEESQGEGEEAFPEQEEVAALNLAMKTITSISASMHNRVGESLRLRMSQILSEITEGRYTQVFMDENLEITVHTQERTVPLERLSRGTVEQIYFALRMAVGDILCQEEEMPIVLDDVFAMYDEERLGAALKWLNRSGRQVLISTCHTREMELLEKLQIPYYEYQM